MTEDDAKIPPPRLSKRERRREARIREIALKKGIKLPQDERKDSFGQLMETMERKAYYSAMGEDYDEGGLLSSSQLPKITRRKKESRDSKDHLKRRHRSKKRDSGEGGSEKKRAREERRRRLSSREVAYLGDGRRSRRQH